MQCCKLCRALRKPQGTLSTTSQHSGYAQSLLTHPGCEPSAPDTIAGSNSSGAACRQQGLIRHEGLAVRGQHQLRGWGHGAGPTDALQAGLLEVALNLTTRVAALQALQKGERRDKTH